MGRLVFLNDLGLDASWYFQDAYYSRDRDRYVHAWPNPSFPYKVSMHRDDLQPNNTLKISIRNWIEENLHETVIYDTVDRSYRRYTDAKQSWEHSYEITNIWCVFYFENEHSATMFALRFSEHIKPISDKHPGW